MLKHSSPTDLAHPFAAPAAVPLALRAPLDAPQSKPIACIVLPTYNEAENVASLLPLIFSQAANIPSHDLHVVVVDDNSPDGTAAVVRDHMSCSPHLHLLTGEKQGLGEAYKRGIAYALRELRAGLILEMDADFQHDPALLPFFIAVANHGFTLVIGSRFIAGGVTPGFPWNRKLISVLGTRLVRLFGRLPALTDCTSGYRCISSALLERCDLSGLASRGYSFQSSLLCELLRNGARVLEIPIVFEDRRRGASKLSFRDQKEFLSNLINLYLRSRRQPSPVPSTPREFLSHPSESPSRQIS